MSKTRFPRTLAEAFADERAQAITRYRPSLASRIVWPIICILSCIAIGAMLAMGV
jgi:hypothetical protein